MNDSGLIENVTEGAVSETVGETLEGPVIAIVPVDGSRTMKRGVEAVRGKGFGYAAVMDCGDDTGYSHDALAGRIMAMAGDAAQSETIWPTVQGLRSTENMPLFDHQEPGRVRVCLMVWAEVE